MFELAIPEAYSNWRDLSAYFIDTMLEYREAKPKAPVCSYTLNNHQDLSHMLSPRYAQRRIIPLSDIKPHSRTHRKRLKAITHLNDEDVCLENALRYAYFDRLGIASQLCWPAPRRSRRRPCTECHSVREFLRTSCTTRLLSQTACRLMRLS